MVTSKNDMQLVISSISDCLNPVVIHGTPSVIAATENNHSLSLNICSFVGTILLTRTTAALNEVALSHNRVRGLRFLAVVLVLTTYV